MKINSTQLGELVKIVGGGTPSRDRQEYFNGNVPWITVKDFSDQFFIRTSQEHISQLGLDSSASRLIPAGNVILCTRMSVGKAAITVKDVAINQDLKALFCCPKLDSKYLVFYLAFIAPYLESRASGATVKGITIDDIKDLAIALPIFSEQQRIAKYLEQADSLRRQHRYTLEMSDSFLPAMFIEMFGDPETNPKRWPSERLGDVAKTTSGGTPDRKKRSYYGGDIPWVKSGELHKHEVTKTEEKLTQLGLENSSAKLMPSGTILMAMYGATVGALSRLAIEAATNQAVCCITPGPTINSDYLMGLLRMLTPKLLSQRVGGAQPNISQEIVRDLLLPIAPLSLQRKYSLAVTEYQRLRSMQIESLRQAEYLFQSLLHQAFSEDYGNEAITN